MIQFIFGCAFGFVIGVIGAGLLAAGGSHDDDFYTDYMTGKEDKDDGEN